MNLLLLLIVTACVAAAFASTVTHVVERRRCRKQTHRLQAEFRRASRDFRALIEHRIGNPLTVIGGAAQTLLADNVRVDDDLQHLLLTTIVTEADRMSALAGRSEDELSIEERCLLPVPRNDRTAHRQAL